MADQDATKELWRKIDKLEVKLSDTQKELAKSQNEFGKAETKLSILMSRVDIIINDTKAKWQDAVKWIALAMALAGMVSGVSLYIVELNVQLLNSRIDSVTHEVSINTEDLHSRKGARFNKPDGDNLKAEMKAYIDTKLEAFGVNR